MEFNEKVPGLPGTFFRRLRKRGKQLKEGAGSKSEEAVKRGNPTQKTRKRI